MTLIRLLFLVTTMAFLVSLPGKIQAQFTTLKYTVYSSPINYEYISPGGWISVPYGSVISVGGKLYGTTTFQGSGGTIFSINPDGSAYTTLFEFNTGVGDGRLPFGSLVSDGTYLYGTTARDNGTIFRINLDGSGFTTLHYFNGLGGTFPISTLILDGTSLYGVTRKGGTNDKGTLFTIETDGTGFTELYNFEGANGDSPAGDLLFDGTFLYGCTSLGGIENKGVLFRISTSGSGYTKLHDFQFATGIFTGQSSPDGNNGALVSDGTYLYGTNNIGGAFNYGNLFRIKPDGTDYSIIYDFDGSYSQPYGSLKYDGTFLYGAVETASSELLNLEGGALFKIKPDGTEFAAILNFGSTTNGNVAGSSILLDGTTLFGIASWSGWNHRPSFNTDASIFKIETNGTGYNKLHEFTGHPEGAVSLGKPILVGSSLYGTSSRGGSRNQGNIFKVDPDGSNYMLLRDFEGYPDGATPSGGLYSDGSYLYGLTTYGGAENVGTIYRIAHDGSSYNVLHEFISPEGQLPVGELILVGSSLIGATSSGGLSSSGTIFKINPDGTGFTTIFSFPSPSWITGSIYYDGSFIYGMATYGGAFGLGYIFKIKPDGTSFTVILNFDGTNGAQPTGNSLISDGSLLYGMSRAGGVHNKGTIFKLLPDGSGYSKLHDFTDASGSMPNGALTLVGSQLYGLAASGTPTFGGAMFKISTDGSGYTRIFDFWDCAASNPNGTLLNDGNDFYGFFTVGLFKLREISVTDFSPTSGPVGTPVVLNGSNLAAPGFPSTTSFNGVLSTQVNTPTSISTVVPAGASTGPITVKRGCLVVNTPPFTVTAAPAPAISGFSPTSGPIGTTVIITGSDFSATPANNLVGFNGTPAIVTASTTSSITTSVPSGATTGAISVTVAGNTATSATPFTVIPLPPVNFFPKIDYSVGTTPREIKMADFDGDGHLDIVTSHPGSSSIRMLKGTGTGCFGAAQTFPASADVFGLATGDLNSDGITDLVTANKSPSNTVSVFLGSSTGFLPAVDYVAASAGAGIGVISLSIGDINADSHPDLVVVNDFTPGFISVLTNTGSGTFNPKISYPTTYYPYFVSIGDVNSDGWADLAVTNYFTNTVGIFINDGAGGFPSETTTYATGNNPVSAILKDLNNDSKPDLVVCNSADNTLGILINNGTGLFSSMTAYSTNAILPYSIVTGDVNNDGHQDIVAGNSLSNAASVHLGSGTGVFEVAQTFSTGSGPSYIDIGDADEDGRLDIVSANSTTTTVSVLITSSNTCIPSIASFTPTSEIIGATVTITGTNFDPTPVNNQVQFNGTNATVISGNTTSLVVTVPGGATTGPITVTVAGNTATSASNFTVVPPSTIVISPQPVSTETCDGATATFLIVASGTTNLVYQWQKFDGSVFNNISDGGGYSGSASATLSVNTTGSYGAGDYRCRVSGDFAPDVFSNSATLTVNPLPAPPVGPNPAPVCTGDPAIITATGSVNGNYRWYDGGTLITGEVNGTYTTPALSSNRTFGVTIHDGTCESPVVSIAATVQTCSPPVIATTIAAPFVPGIIRIDLTALLSDPENNLDLSTLEIISGLPSGATATIDGTELVIDYGGMPFPGIETIVLRVCDLTDQCSDDTTVTINLSTEILIFNAISPNADGKNEGLFIANIDLLPETQQNKLTLFNRWGSVVFEAVNYNNTTNSFLGLGKNGEELPSGTYFYTLEFSSGAPKRTGFISLRK